MKLVRLSKSNRAAMTKIALICFGKKYTEKEIKKWYGKRLDGSYKETDKVLEYFLALEKSKPVGITGFFNLNKGRKVFWLGYFGVIPSKMKRCLGSKILAKTIEMAKKNGAKRFSLWGSVKKAEEFYNRNGFRKIKGMKAIIENGKVIYKFPKNTYFYSKRV